MREVHAYVYACALDYVDADRCAASEDSPAGAEVYTRRKDDKESWW